MSKDKSEKFAGQFTGEVLKAAIKVLLDDGHKVTVNNLPAKENRPAGLLLFVEGMTYEDGVFAVAEQVPA